MLGLFKEKKLSYRVEGKDHRFVFPRSKKVESVLRNHEFSEEGLQRTRRLFGLVGNPRVILDIGANIGYRAVHYFHSVRPERIHCFEPSAYNFRLLNRNVAGLPGVSTHPIGMSDRDGSGKLSMPDVSQNAKVANMKDHTGFLSLHGKPGAGSEEIRLTSLDQWVAENEPGLRGAFVKIDVEGHELSVLRGATGTLAQDHVFQIEFNPVTFRMSQTTPQQILDLMSANGYIAFLYDGNALRPLNVPDLDHTEDLIFKKGT